MPWGEEANEDVESRECPLIERPALALVEGKDDLGFLGAILGSLDLGRHVTLRTYGGRPNMRREVGATPSVSGFDQVRAVAVFRDADESAAAAVDSIRGAIEQADLPVPERVGEFAHRPHPTRSRALLHVGCFVFPGGGRSGALEDLCLETVGDHSVMECVEGYMQCLQEKCTDKSREEPKDRSIAYFPRNASKAKARAFMAGLWESPVFIGRAAESGYFDLDHPSLDPVKVFLRRLVELGHVPGLNEEGTQAD